MFLMLEMDRSRLRQDPEVLIQPLPLLCFWPSLSLLLPPMVQHLCPAPWCPWVEWLLLTPSPTASFGKPTAFLQ